jgi:hypothetical protein
MDMENQQEISRRSFMKWTALAAAVTAARKTVVAP